LKNANSDSLRLETQPVKRFVTMERWKMETSADLVLKTTARNVLSVILSILSTALNVLKERNVTLTVGSWDLSMITSKVNVLRNVLILTHLKEMIFIKMD